MQFLEALFILSEWQALCSLLKSSQPKEIDCYEEKKWLLQWFSYFHTKLGRRKVVFAWGFMKTETVKGARTRNSVAKVSPTEATTLHVLWEKSRLSNSTPPPLTSNKRFEINQHLC